MRRVLASIGIAALAFIAAAPANAAEPPDGPGAGPLAFGQPVINEVQTRGSGGALDQFVEIINPSRTSAVDLSGWFVQVYNNTNVVLQTIFIPDGTVLLPLGSGPSEETFWTMSSTAFTGGAVDQPGVIVVDIPPNGAVALFNPGGMKIDGVSFSPGATTALEGTALTPQPAALDFLNPSYGRNIVGQDTDNNLNDFKLLTRSPDTFN